MKHITPISIFLIEGEFYQSGLNKEFWHGDKFDPDVRTKLIQIAHDFYKDLKVTIPIEDIQLTGSLANYNWTEHSDLDVHVIMDLSKINEDVELVKKALDGIKFQWNIRHKVEIRGHDIELYGQDLNQLHLASGLYSLMKDEWIRKPKYEPPTIDPKDVHRKVEAYMTQIEELEKEYHSIKSPSDATDVMEKANVIKKKISKTRDEQLVHKGGEFSVENLVFKELRNNGAIGKLIKLKSLAYSKIYSEPMNAALSKVKEVSESDSSKVSAKGGIVLVKGPEMVDGSRLFLFWVTWEHDVARGGRLVGLESPMQICEKDGQLYARKVTFGPGDLTKYTGLKTLQTGVNSKRHTPLWYHTIKYSSPEKMLSELAPLIKAIPGIKLNFQKP